MENIQDVSIETCTESKYLRPYRLRYKQNGREKIWDVMDTGDSVSILVYNPFRKVFIFVKQFRPAVYSCNSKKYEENGVKKIDLEKYPAKLGVTHELCAGLVDKDCSVIEIAQQELLEELGYKVPLYKIEKITTFRSGVGASGNLQTMFYSEVSDVMKVNAGGGLESEGELIETVEIPVTKGREMIYDESINKPAGMMFGLLWFYENKYKPSGY
ncbi:hypothetical protein LOTGIDRAFT_150029 [Lottia gigantea]|uniref:Uridine diphosphate glucose pyrophosphatase NUDT14 n=1 Tax=Lottia gigantea TaxID=225164 RepID=V4ARV0_LOTGI|nr:hypothetical protein LOTGIDRAFT_150029 [Lottia gigantea]ESO96421.1 hypothetical protein LOTGIDRAFT_150029 [Lottia gigantea]